ncbi:MAG: hypothetical protein GXO44_05290 [Deferribacteres bacterium]|nr:hypothetical protein [Deferribacteres bacterium]
MPKGFLLERNASDAIKELVRALIEKGLVGGAVLPVRLPTGDNYAFVFTRDEETISSSAPISPVMPVQGARVLSKLTKKQPLSKAAVAVLKPCEVRASIELAKINQLDRNSFVFVSFDCPGVYSLKSYRENPDGVEAAFSEECSSFSLSNPRPLCAVCEDFTGEFADIEVQFVGIKGTKVVAKTEKGLSFLKEIGWDQQIDDEDREEIKKIKEERLKARQAFKEEFGSMVDSPEKLLDVLSSCINCHNCRSVCPICFCRECFFDSTALRVPPHLYLERARRKGGLRFMPDTLLFHLGRMNHMSLSCVSCGMCEDACPNMVPVGRLFSLVSERTRAIFGYKPGRDINEPIPYLEFREEELEEYEVPYFEARE